MKSLGQNVEIRATVLFLKLRSGKQSSSRCSMLLRPAAFLRVFITTAPGVKQRL